MASNGHAFLSASAANRWIHCPPSARLSAKYKDITTEYAAEGTEAHALCEFKLRTALGEEATCPIETMERYSEEMEECAEGYVDFVMEELEAAKSLCKDPVVLVEERVDFSRWVKNGFGTADAIVVADQVLSICDYKHGLGHVVDAFKNPQLLCYALGALEIFEDFYDIGTIKMTIYQPRRSNVSSYEISKDELYKWAEEVLKPTADLAFSGSGKFLCGEWCSFCKVKHECRARAEANLLLAQYDFKKPPLLEHTEIEVILSKVEQFISWANDVKDYALQQAVSGKRWQGWKLVEGRAIRKYSSEAAVIKTVEEAGYEPYEKKLLGVTAMQKLLGKQQFEELLSRYISKPQGKPTLVPESDKRPAMNTAVEDFNEN